MNFDPFDFQDVHTKRLSFQPKEWNMATPIFLFLSDHIHEIWEKLKNHRNVRLRLLFEA
ncbi:hypothetical protein BDD39_003257 [Saccharococcus thermophilus]|uniref:Uncharacterized protein n=1 Tax=Saccharococcus thermophilus TaxID=29396 RepID=A0A846MLR0_9BACL|nr:hypothetical protein [Saccharococcus thermophilus]